MFLVIDSKLSNYNSNIKRKKSCFMQEKPCFLLEEISLLF